MKVVINKCYGGFGLSDEAMVRLAELRGHPLFIEPNPTYKSFKDYWVVPLEQRTTPKAWHEATLDERRANNEAYEREHMDARPEKRDDPLLVQVVEELGDKASGTCAELRVVEIPDGIDYEIDEYDGLERIREKHRSWY